MNPTDRVDNSLQEPLVTQVAALVAEFWPLLFRLIHINVLKRRAQHGQLAAQGSYPKFPGFIPEGFPPSYTGTFGKSFR